MFHPLRLISFCHALFSLSFRRKNTQAITDHVECFIIDMIRDAFTSQSNRLHSLPLCGDKHMSICPRNDLSLWAKSRKRSEEGTSRYGVR